MAKLIIVTADGVEVRDLDNRDQSKMKDSKGALWTGAMLRWISGSGRTAMYAVMVEPPTLVRIDQFGKELVGLALHQILSVETSALRIVQWVVLGVLALATIWLAVQVSDLRGVWLQDISVLKALMQQLLSVSSPHPEVIVP